MLPMFGLRANRRVLGALVVGLSVTSGLAGCGDTASDQTQIKQTTPGGSTTETIKSEVKQTGDNPPPPTGATPTPAPK
jgi:hypothetical protein